MDEQLAVGWDVGGWSGKKQAIAVLVQTDGVWQWAGLPKVFRLNSLSSSEATLVDFIRAGWPDVPDDVLDRYRVTVAIDAPLGFPFAFQKLVTRDVPDQLILGTHIDNALAFRATDRWVHRTYGKMPLSASFDKLGNNATVAISYTDLWKRQCNLATLPFQSGDDARHVAIEVYPALVKSPGKKECHLRFSEFMPDRVAAGTHEYDAAICAVLASAWLNPRIDTAGQPMSLVEPPSSITDNVLACEGWIYAVSPDWLANTSRDQQVSPRPGRSKQTPWN